MRRVQAFQKITPYEFPLLQFRMPFPVSSKQERALIKVAAFFLSAPFSKHIPVSFPVLDLFRGALGDVVD